MVAKGKGKQKAIAELDVGALKTADDRAKSLEIIRRLRKGHNLEPLLVDARLHAKETPSAISLLCLAKVQLAQAVDGLMSTSLTGESRSDVASAQQAQLEKAMDAARRGALEHGSILCGRFYYHLAEIAKPDFESLKFPHIENLADPKTELLEQV